MFDAFSDLSLDKRWRQQIQPAPIVVAIIRRRNGEIEGPEPDTLLIRRNSAPYNDHWAMVGGKWDFGEPLAEAAMREVREETGLLTRFVALRGVVSERLTPPAPDSAGAAHFLILVCHLEVVSGEAQEQQEGAVAWFKPADIEDMYLAGTIIPSDYMMLKQFSGADTIPFFEAEMVSGGVDGTTKVKPDLHRFEQIIGHAPSAD